MQKIIHILNYIVFTIIILCSFGRAQISIDPLVAHIDSTVRPGDDFFLFANGKWFRENPIPANEASNGIFQIIQDTINAQIRFLCESSAVLKSTKKGSNKQKIGDFFFSGMDSISLNEHGLKDLQENFRDIDAVKDLTGLLKIAARIHMIAGSPFFNFFVGQDDRISSKNAVFIWQGGLSLPDRSFYFDTDDRTQVIRSKFIEHLGNMFRLIGEDQQQAKKSAESVMKLETSLAQASRKIEDTRDPVKNYNKISFQQLKNKTNHLEWNIFTKEMGLRTVDTVIMGQPEFLDTLNKYFSTFPLSDWKKYLKYHLVRGLARFADDKAYMEYFNFYSKALYGVEEPKPRWERVAGETDNALGELIGQVYISEYLPKGTKEKLLEIGNAVKAVYAERIKKLDWMSEKTKVKALNKLDKIIMKVGYPDKWKDMNTLQVERSSYVRNVMQSNAWAVRYNISKYGKPVDRTEWYMQPQTYNAYYNPSNNEICVPGCNIIVPGYERVLADDAILYSIIGGSTFGHEITHGFDDQGCKYDEQGNLNNWWTVEDSVKFYKRTKLIVEQFNGYIAVDSLHINGEMTQGENIADLAGVMIGYDAFKKTNQFRRNEIVAGLNPGQRYFLSYAFAWMVNQRPEGITSQVKSDVHSPAKFRVIGPLSDVPEFYKAFGVKQGDVMWRPESARIVIW